MIKSKNTDPRSQYNIYVMTWIDFVLLQGSTCTKIHTSFETFFFFFEKSKNVTLKYLISCVIGKDGFFSWKYSFSLWTKNGGCVSQKSTLIFHIFCMIDEDNTYFSCKYDIPFWWCSFLKYAKRWHFLHYWLNWYSS